MLQAHSLLWHYLWVAPNVLLLILAALIWRRELRKQFPVFLIFTVVIAIEQLVVYAADVIPAVSGPTFWRLFWAGLLVEFTVISHAHILDQTIYLIECGLLLFIFLFAAYFKLGWNNASFGIALGLGISACVHLATWAVMANGGMMDKRHLLDFLNMATYHICVLIWFYYLLVPRKVVTTSAVPLPEHSLAVWNQELERLLHQ